ncbi:transketolase [Microbacterium sp. MPKO10]|uniref:transketolase family protein n=1 Tax=Microbacterium sp. MPKO10 TaxID=2989818 RepID=UPI0022362AB3|nr:transketolase [Microbacterium sp. MPKO10]MCW4459966.1 transketolase [Microbacterium sp. MPKO10]
MSPTDAADEENTFVRHARDESERRAVAAAIAIPPVVVQAKGHGHAGTAMAMAPLAHTLFHRVLRHNPANPNWEGRDRFILSAGHASLLLYTQLHLSGYDLTLDDIAHARTLDARTPGHPELGVTAGVEMSTGPLGQGIASAVGLALSIRRDAALHGAGSDVWNSTVFALAGDGCLEEGVSAEAASLAGTLGLGNLVAVWDDNRITIDGAADIAFTEDVRARFRAYGWRVLEISDFRDIDEIETVLTSARRDTGAPTLVAVRSVIGSPSAKIGGTSAAHAGALGAEETAAVLTALGFAPETALDDLVDDTVGTVTRLTRERGARLEREWLEQFETWRSRHPELAERREALQRAFPHRGSPVDASAALEALESLDLPAVGAQSATRATNGEAIRALCRAGITFGGSADLSGSTSVAIPGEAVSTENPGGDFVHFGIREHAMAAVMTGIALHGLWRPYGSTYLTFSDYQRPSIRLAALMELPVTYIYTHDSVAVGEDGPTHQPVEQIASLRTVPGLCVIRPADAAEVISAWKAVVTSSPAPTAFILSRQGVAVLEQRDNLDDKVANGAYVVWQSGDGMDAAIIATGSEVAVAINAARELAGLGTAVRVISMPCVEWFERSSAAWQESVLPARLRARVAVEAGRGDAWFRWVGLDGRVVSVDEFGESGAGDEVLARKGITAAAVVEATRDVVSALYEQ